MAREGLGYLIGFLGANGTYDAMYAVVLTVAFLGFAADRGYQMLMNRMLRWREQTHVTAERTCGQRPRRRWRARCCGASRACSRSSRWSSPGRCWRAAGTFTPFVLPSLTSVLERIWADAVSGDLCHQHRRSRSIARWSAS